MPESTAAMARQTLILSGHAIAGTIDLKDCIDAVERAFGRYARGRMAVPDVVHIAADHGAFHVKSAGFVDAPGYVAVKVNGNFPDNRNRSGLPTIQGAIILCDGKNGFPLAILDSIEITALRTGAATAVAAKHLARHDADAITIIGCGLQGEVQLLALQQVLPLKTAYAFDIDAERRMAYVQALSAKTGMAIQPIERIADGTLKSSVVVTCTSSRRAFLGRSHVRPGTFIAAVGADNDDKQELEPELLRQSRVVVDVLEQCEKIGELHHALASGAMTRSEIAADLGSIVAGLADVRFADDDIIVFDSTGSAIQDVAAAGIVYERSRDQGLGFAVELGRMQ